MITQLGYENYLRHWIHGATTKEEQAWCRYFAAEEYTGRGCLVEWGCWLGSLTKSTCEGLLENSRIEKSGFYNVYDNFEWKEFYENWVYDKSLKGRFKPGESFYPYFCDLVSQYSDYLNIIKCDLNIQKWHGGEIELIINDAVKTIEIGKNVFKEFVPSLIPRKSLIAHQDYLWASAGYLHIFMYLFRDSFTYEYSLDNSSMAIFRYVKEGSYDLGSLDDLKIDSNLIEETFQWSEFTMKDVNPRLLRLCHALALFKSGLREDAIKFFRENDLGREESDKYYNNQLRVLRKRWYTDLFKSSAYINQIPCFSNWNFIFKIMRIEKSYIICSLPRSGSTLLGAALAKTGLAGNPREYFKKDTLAVMNSRFGLPADAPLSQSVEKVVVTTRTSNGVFGQKVMWNHLEELVAGLTANDAHLRNLPIQNLVAKFFQKPKLIFIRRENRIKQAISYSKAMQSDVWHKFQGTEAEEKFLSFDYCQIKTVLNNIERQEQQWKKFLQDGNFEYYETTYETLVGDFEKTMTEILEFLGLHSQEIPSLDDLGFFPTRSEINSRWESRYLEVDERVREFDRSDIVKTLPDSGFRASITTDQTEYSVHKYEKFTIKVKVRNTSDCPWNSIGAADFRYWIQLKSRWINNAEEVVKTLWANFPEDCPPEKSIEFEFLQQAPPETGQYTLEFDMVQNGVAAFSSKGNPVLRLHLTVGLSDFQSRIADYFGEFEQLAQFNIHVPWLGSLDISKFPSVYHQSHGWLYCDDQGAKTDSFWFKTLGLGYLWTSREKYPLIYSDDKKTWLEHVKDTWDPPQYRDTETGERLTGIRGNYD